MEILIIVILRLVSKVVHRLDPSDGFCGVVYMTLRRLSPRSEFTPVPSHGSTFVYMIPPQYMLCRRESPRREFTPVLAPGREFHSDTKSRNGIM